MTREQKIQEVLKRLENYSLQTAGGLYLNNNPQYDLSQSLAALSALCDEEIVAELEEFRPGKDTDIEHLQRLVDHRIATLNPPRRNQ